MPFQIDRKNDFFCRLSGVSGVDSELLLILLATRLSPTATNRPVDLRICHRIIKPMVILVGEARYTAFLPQANI